MRTNNSLIVFLNVVLVVLGIGILFFAALIWMGTKDDFDELVNNSYWKFFTNRLIFSLINGLVILAMVGLINYIIKNILKLEYRSGEYC